MNKALLAALLFVLAFAGSVLLATPLHAQYICTDPNDPACDGEGVAPDPDYQPKAPTPVLKLDKGVKLKDEQGLNNVQDLTIETELGKYAVIACGLGGKGLCSSKILKKMGEADSTLQSGVLGTATSLIAGMYQNPPADTSTYIASLKRDLRLGSPVYAQGLGFSALSPILSIWTTMRNIAYFFFIIAFILIGFMIMFRQKISGQAVVTAQQAIPSIIIALLTVTFSYAIAGLLIDGMYLLMFLIAGLFGKVELINGNVFDMGMRLIGNGAAIEGGVAIGEIVKATVGTPIVDEISGFISNIGATVIILLVIVFNMFRLFFTLLKVYIEIILNIAFAPVILMMGAIPGQNPFGRWVKDLVGNLAVFPALLIILVTYDVISNSMSNTSGGFLPPYVAGYTAASVVPLLAGTALILALPNVVEETRKAFGVSQTGFFGNLIQAGIKNAQSGVGSLRKVEEAQPFSLMSPSAPFRTTGKETMVERLLVGSRAERREELRLRDQAAAFNRTHVVRQGGIASVLNNWRERRMARREAGGGAGGDVDVPDA